MILFIMFFFCTSSCAHINYKFIYNLRIVGSKLYMCYWKTEFGESYQGLLEFYSSWWARNSVMMTLTHRFFTCQTRLRSFHLKKLTSLPWKLPLSFEHLAWPTWKTIVSYCPALGIYYQFSLYHSTWMNNDLIQWST